MVKIPTGSKYHTQGLKVEFIVTLPLEWEKIQIHLDTDKENSNRK